MSNPELTGYQPAYVLFRSKKASTDEADQQELLLNYLGIAAHYVAAQPDTMGTAALQEAISKLPGLTAADVSSNSATQVFADEDGAAVDLVALAAAQVLETLSLGGRFKSAFEAFFKPPLREVFNKLVAQQNGDQSVHLTIGFGLVNAAVSFAPTLNFVGTKFALRKEKKAGVFGSASEISVTIEVEWNGYELGSSDTACKFVGEETKAGLITDLSKAGLLKTYTIDT